MILVLYKDDGRIVGVYPGGEIKGRDVFCGNQRVASNIKANWALIPDQDVGSLCTEDEEGSIILSGRFPDDVKTFSSQERAALVDRDTGKAIDGAIHPFAGIEEQIGILRAQIAEILVALGLDPTDEFAKLNAIAAEKIQESRKKKEILDAKDS